MDKKNNYRSNLVIWVYLTVFVAWWVFINVIHRSPEHNASNAKLFAATYGAISLFGGVLGLIASSKWGGRKSLIGRALMFFALGLLAQEFGQIAYSIYQYVLKVDIPYPSVGDIGYFGSVIFYILAVWQLSKAAGFKFSLKDPVKKSIPIIIPLILLGGSYFYFLRGYQFDFSTFKSSLTVLLDFGYPLGQAMYIAIAIITYMLSKKLLGGLMKNKILLIISALFIQYIADSSFLYAAKYQKFYAAGANDLMYLIAYAVMGLALNTFRINLMSTGKAGSVKSSSVGEGAK